MGSKQFRKRLRTALLVSIAGCTYGAATRADDAPTAVVVVDGSASMWGRLMPENRPKIEVAQEALAAAIRRAPQTRIGLVSFGQSRADCTDAGVLNPPDTQHDGLLQTLSKLNPRGRGPLAFALRAAAGAIGNSRPARLLVVSDGADNCAQDACKAAQELAKSAPGVTVDVVGVAVAANEKAFVSCLATETGGRYLAAETAAEFTAALDELSKVALFPTQAPASALTAGAPAAPALPPPPAGASLRIAASLAKGTPPLDVAIKWRIFKAGETAPAAESEGQAVSLKLPPGDYEVEARLGELSAREKLSIVPGSAQSISIPLAAAHLVGRVSPTKGGPPSPTAVLSLTTAEKSVRIVSGGIIDLYLPPGRYSLLAVDGTARQTEEFVLDAGTDKAVAFALRTGTIELSTTPRPSSEAPADVLYVISEDAPESPTGRREVARSRAATVSFTLPAGTYYVSARSGDAVVEDRVALNVGDIAKRPLNLTAASLKATATFGGAAPASGQSVVLKVERVEGDKGEVVRAIGSNLEFSLNPGRYRVTANLPGPHLSASKDIVIEPGKSIEAKIDIPGATIEFSPPAGGSDVYWEVTDAKGAAIWRATGRTVKAILAPGAYTVHCDGRGKRKSVPFELRAGESRSMELGPG